MSGTVEKKKGDFLVTILLGVILLATVLLLLPKMWNELRPPMLRGVRLMYRQSESLVVDNAGCVKTFLKGNDELTNCSQEREERMGKLVPAAREVNTARLDAQLVNAIATGIDEVPDLPVMTADQGSWQPGFAYVKPVLLVVKGVACTPYEGAGDNDNDGCGEDRGPAGTVPILPSSKRTVLMMQENRDGEIADFGAVLYRICDALGQCREGKKLDVFSTDGRTGMAMLPGPTELGQNIELWTNSFVWTGSRRATAQNVGMVGRFKYHTIGLENLGQPGMLLANN